MTESEALKRFIPILGRISLPGERVIITRNILNRIAGVHTGEMGVSHKHAGALAWPSDANAAKAFEAAMDTAVDAGEFVSVIHPADRRHFQIEELASWPDCPAIAPDSPLVFWLGEPAPEQASPEPVAPSASDAPAWTVNKSQRERGYNVPLHRLLAAANKEGKPRPTARDVVEAWRINRPAEIEKVLNDGIDYYDTKGNAKPADLEAIRKAIKRMTSAR